MIVHARSLIAYSELAEFIDRYPRLMVLTGAGISVESGINTYRDHEGRWLVRKPIQHAEFIADATVRQRYWTRSTVGWPAVGAAQPNVAHRALAQLEQQGHVSLLLTQNVDRLHQAAGHQKVIDLHGRLDRAQCLSCHKRESRAQIQTRLLNQNNHLASSMSPSSSSLLSSAGPSPQLPPAPLVSAAPAAGARANGSGGALP